MVFNWYLQQDHELAFSVIHGPVFLICIFINCLLWPIKKFPHLYVGSFYLSLINTVRTRLELVISSVTGMRPKPTRPTDQNCGGWIWTNDLRVMSPTSYQAALPRDNKDDPCGIWTHDTSVKGWCLNHLTNGSLRRRRDSNPRTACAIYTLSRGASSATWVLLQWA